MPNTTTLSPLTHKDVLTIAQLDRGEILRLFETAAAMKRSYAPFRAALQDRTIVLLFEKASLRTRVSFEAGMARLGGTAVYLDHQSNRIGARESIADYGRNLERWTDGLVARTYQHATIEALAASTRIPVINALSDWSHPCQALADYFTLAEHLGGLDGLRVAYVGDGNNVCHSLMFGAAKLGVAITVITPRRYPPLPEVVGEAKSFAAASGGSVELTDDVNAVEGHHAVYTDTWVSMGQESDAIGRVAAFKRYQVTEPMMKKAGNGALFMHCLPAHRGEEVAADVIDSPRSIVFDQAENRMHVQNAILLHTVGARPRPTFPTPKPQRPLATSR